MEQQIKDIFGNNLFLFVAGLFAFLFKNTIEKFAASIFVFFGNDYNEDDIVMVNGRPGRIVRVGWTKTTFFLYTIQNGIVSGGTKLVVQNEKLSSMNIEKPLENLEIPKNAQKS
tara:strand:+ start:373 stop:714 length:342 start_codon:yes stop_codon:yes gene_type:complete